MGMNIMRMKGRAKMMRTIKVTGKGKIAVKPDKIRLYVNKEELCKEYEDTLRRSTEDTELLKDLFEKLGFQRKDLKTVYFNVDTEYESYQDRDKSWKRRFKGYKYNHHMKIEFAADNKRLGQVLYALAHSSLRPEFSIEYTVADVEKCKNELLHKAIEDSIQKAQVLTTAANVKEWHTTTDGRTGNGVSGKKRRKSCCVSAALMKRPLSRYAWRTGQTSIPTGGFTDGRMTLRNILRTWQAGSGRRKWVRLRSYWKRLRAKISIKY